MEHQGEYLRQSAMPSDMGMEAHMQMMERRHLATLWCHFANALLGCWLLSAPFIFGYSNLSSSDLDLARLDQHLGGATAVGQAGGLQQGVERDELAAQREVELLHAAAAQAKRTRGAPRCRRPMADAAGNPAR